VLAAAIGRPPAPWTLGRLDDPELTQAVARSVARRAAALGLDRLLAPCADVLTARRSPVIGVRAFGEEPARVATHVAATVAGLLDGGVRCCLKHWPGHGAAVADSHEGFAAVAAAEPAPFAAGVAAGADAVMLGHLTVGDGELPATLDPAAAAAARALGRSLLLFADDVTMGALRVPLAGLAPAGEGLLPTAELPRAWFERIADGGCDRLLCRGIPWAAFPLEGDAPRDAEAAAGDGTTSPDPLWSRVWRRAAGPPFAGPDATLHWWAVRPDHRWGGLAPAAFAAAGWTGGLEPLGSSAPGAVEHLVVGGHGGPDVLIAEGFAAYADRLAPAGRCLVLGHPGLETALRERLPAAWSLVHCSDFGRDELAACLRGDGSSQILAGPG
jgi:hypothetical protein